MKKLAVVASGWHFPSTFYENVAKQKLPEGWEMDLFCISHRDPEHAAKEKKGRTFAHDRRGVLDAKLYKSIIAPEAIEKLGWKYTLEPNTVGDFGNSNQWLAKHNYKDYDLILFTHDDNFPISDEWFKDVIEDDSYEDWDILANTTGMPPGWVRGSCEFFKPEVIEKMGGSFDLSEVTLDRTGETTVSEDTNELYDWNNTVNPLMRFIEEEEIQVGFLAPGYRFSMYLLEGERGYISSTHGANTQYEERNLDILSDHGVI